METIIFLIPNDYDFLSSFQRINKEYSLSQNEYNDLIIQNDNSKIYLNLLKKN